MTTVRDRLWIWGHEAGSHDSGYNVPGPSRMTPAEAAFYLDVPNIIMVRFRGRPSPPYDQYAIPFRPLERVVWSIVGAGGRTQADERDHVFELAARYPNITGVMMDDFFRPSSDGGEPAALSLDALRTERGRLTVSGRRLDLWVVLYTHQLDLPVTDYLALCDRVTFWTWEATDLTHLKDTFEKAEALAPAGSLVLGCYMWDYGLKRPVPTDLMEMQCQQGLEWLREGRIQGMIFLASCVCDIGLDAVEWTRRWIAQVGDETL